MTDEKKPAPVVDTVEGGYEAYYAENPKRRGKGRTPDDAIADLGGARRGRGDDDKSHGGKKPE